MFGREVSGLTAAEVDACDMSLSIPIGRLQGEEQGNAAGWVIVLCRRCCLLLVKLPQGHLTLLCLLCPHPCAAAESMSLSHAVSVVLSRLFERRQQAGGYALPQGLADLATGYEESGVER